MSRDQPAKSPKPAFRSTVAPRTQVLRQVAHAGDAARYFAKTGRWSVYGAPTEELVERYVDAARRDAASDAPGVSAPQRALLENLKWPRPSRSAPPAPPGLPAPFQF